MPEVDLLGADDDESLISSGGAVQEFASGLAGGVLRDPIVGFAADKLGLDPEMRSRFEGAASGTTAGKVGAFVGEWGPMVVGTLGLYSVGRRLALEGIAKLAVGRVGVGTAEAIAGGEAVAEGGFVGRQLAATAAKGVDLGLIGDQALAAAAKGYLPKPALMRVSELIGGNAAAGLYSGAQEYARSGDPGDAVKGWGIASALGMGLEGGTALLGKAMGVRIANSRDAYARWARDPEQAELVKAHMVGLESKAKELGRNLPLPPVGRTYDDLVRELGVDPTERVLQAGLQAQRMAIGRSTFKGTPEEGITRLLGISAEARAAKEMFETAGPLALMRSPAPGVFGGEGLQSTLLQIAKSPETGLQELGVPGIKALQGLAGAEAEYNTALAGVQNSITNKDGSGLLQKFGAALGKRRPTNGKFLLEEGVVDDYMRNGMQGTPQHLRGSFADVEALLADVNQRAQAAGAEVAPTAEQIGRRGRFPLVVDRAKAGKDFDGFVGKFAKFVAGERNISLDDAKTIAKSVVNRIEDGDHWALAKATGAGYKELTEAGVPVIEDPLRALEQHLLTREHRVAFTKYLGPKFQLKNLIYDMVEMGGGNKKLMQDIIVGVTQTTPFDAAMSSFLQGALNLQMATKLTTSVLPNMAQTSADVLSNGLARTFRGMYRAVAGSADDKAWLAGTGIAHSVWQQASEGFLDPNSATWGAKIARHALSKTGFLGVEGFNRTVNGQVGRISFMDDLMMAAAGRLRGNNLDIARRRMAQMGFDLGDLVQTVRGTPGASIEQRLSNWLGTEAGQTAQRHAAYNATKLSQSIPTPLRKPLMWQTPIGRVVAQFKSFSYNHAKMMREAVLKEAVEGNMKPAAYFLSLYPAMGEVVGDLRSVLTGKERKETGASRYLANMFSLGGLGLITDYYTATRRGYGAETFIGPTLGDFANFSRATFSSIAKGSWDPAVKEVARIPLVRTTANLLSKAAPAAEDVGDWIYRHSGEAEGGEEYPVLAPNAVR